MNDLLVDLRFALRSLLRRPGFAAVVILTLAVGIGVNAAFFGYLSYLLWPTVEAPEPERIVRLYTGTEQQPTRPNSYSDWLDVEASSDVFAPLASYRMFGSALADRAQTLHAWGNAVSGGYFALFGEKAHLGRLIEPADDRPGAERVLVLNHFFWRQRFGSDPTVIGRTVELDGRRAYRIIGVAREGFQGDGLAASIYVPLATTEGFLLNLDKRDFRGLHALGRLRPEVSLEEARAAMTAIGRGLDEAHLETEPRRLSLMPVTEASSEVLADPLVTAAKILMAAVVLLLLLACANVANLMLARAVARRREMGIHAALGAGRLRLGRRLLIESLVLSGLGGVLGLGLARAITKVIERYLLQGMPVGMGDLSAGSSLVADPQRMTFFFVTACVATGVAIGLAPLSHTLRSDLVGALKSDAAGEGPGRRLGLRQLLVVAQVALSVVLLLGAGLLMRTLWQVRTVSPGFDTRDLMLTTFHLPVERTLDSAEGRKLLGDVLEQVRGLPGVSAASLVQRIPLSVATPSTELSFPGSGEAATVNANFVSPGYFATLGIPLLIGRDFDASDRRDTPGVVVINQAAAEKYFPGRDPLGEHVVDSGATARENGSYEIVGVVADTRYTRLIDPAEPLFYFAVEQRFRQRMTLVARSAAPLARPLAELLRERWPDLAVIDLQPFSEQMRRALADQRMNADLAGGFGSLGLGLAGLGIFSVMSYTVSRRGREIGIRMAIGASTQEIGRWVLGGAGRLVGAGLVVGLAAAWALARLLESMLYGVTARDPMTFVVVAVVLGGVAFLAALLPARRAARIDPIRALRGE